jgi:hypothetical protein
VVKADAMAQGLDKWVRVAELQSREVGQGDGSGVCR